MNRVVEVFAFTVVSLFLLANVDEILIDFYYYIWGRRNTSRRLKISHLDQEAPKPIAILVAAWNEENVIRQMLENTFSSINYPRSFYHVFVGTYKNDIATNEAIRPLLEIYRNLHLVVNEQNGPTSKADNLNNMITGIAKFEETAGIKFSILMVHDSEDVIHPTSLKLVNYLIPKHQVIQLPVFPLQPKPTLRNFFKYVTAGVYADEFAENHLKVLASREATASFVPSAGVGFAVNRDVLARIKKESDGQIFTQRNLTEDYDFALRIYKLGLRTHYFIEPVARVLDNGKVVTEHIASRSMFPNTFQRAVKQKSRWIYGIAFQSVMLREFKKMEFIKFFTIYRDWKAKYTNLILIPGYVLLAYIVLSLFFLPLPALFRIGSLLWWLSVLLSIVAIERQVMRGIAVKQIYGWRSLTLSVLLPPILPVRYVWGNIINFWATIQAWRIRLSTPTARKRWAKTEHNYPPPQMLAYYRRKLGDLLLERDLIDAQTLSKIIRMQTTKKLGEIVRDEGLVDEDQLIPLLGELLGSGYVNIDKKIIDPRLRKYLPEWLARRYVIVPILRWQGGMLLAASDQLPNDAVTVISQQTGLSINVTLAKQHDIEKAIEGLYKEGAPAAAGIPRIGELLVEKGLISDRELIEAFHVQRVTHKKIGQVLVEMHLLKEKQLNEVLPPAPSKLSGAGGPEDSQSFHLNPIIFSSLSLLLSSLSVLLSSLFTVMRWLVKKGSMIICRHLR